MSQHFGATNRPGTCLWCGRKLLWRWNTVYDRVALPKPKGPCGIKGCTSTTYYLQWDSRTARRWWHCDNPSEHRRAFAEKKVVKERTKIGTKPGNYGDGHFCGLSCGYLFGVAMANFGHRLKPKPKKD